MDREKWRLIFDVIGLVIALVAVLAGIANPEIRRWAGLEHPEAQREAMQSPETTERRMGQQGAKTEPADQGWSDDILQAGPPAAPPSGTHDYRGPFAVISNTLDVHLRLSTGGEGDQSLASTGVSSLPPRRSVCLDATKAFDVKVGFWAESEETTVTIEPGDVFEVVLADEATDSRTDSTARFNTLGFVKRYDLPLPARCRSDRDPP